MKEFILSKKMGVSFLMAFLFLISLNFVTSTVDTEDVQDTFKINEIITYSKACFNNGTYCSSSAVCNYTFFRPNDNSVLINNVQASNNGSNHNITLFFDTLGQWQIDMVCHDGSLQGSETFYAQVTSDGTNTSIMFLIIIFAIAFLLVLGGFLIPDAWITILGSFLGIFLGIWIIRNGIAGVQNLNITYAVGLILMFVSSYIAIASAWEMMNDGGV